MSGPDDQAREREDDPLELDLDFDMDLNQGSGGEAEAQAAAPTPASPEDEEPLLLDLDHDAHARTPDQESPAPAAPQAAEPAAPTADGGLDLYGTSDPEVDAPDHDEAEPLGVAETGDGAFSNEFDLADGGEESVEVAYDSGGELEISDDAPEGAYDRPEAEFALDDSVDGSFAADDLDIDFEAPAPKSNRGVVVLAGLAGAVATGVMAVVSPGSSAPTPAPAPRTAPTTVAEAPVPPTVERVLLPGLGPAGDDFDLLSRGGLSLTDRARLLAELGVSSLEANRAADAEVAAETSETAEIGEVALEVETTEAPGFEPNDPTDEAQPADAPPTPEAVAAVEQPEVDELRDSRTAVLDVMDQLLLPEDNSGIAFVTADDLSDVWMSEELPPDGVNGRVNRLTPLVGPVRMTTQRGELFEGSLYAIGGGELSLSNHLGRMTFSARQVADVVRMPFVGDTAAAADASAPAMPRVRVRVPGGWLEGRLLSRSQGRVVLLTESGGQVTLDAAEVEPLGRFATTAYPALSQAGVEQIAIEEPEEDRAPRR